MALQVIGWRDIFEVGRTRSIDHQIACLIPNKQNGEGYTQLLDMENGEAMYGAFCAMILLLSKQPADSRNGWLTEDGLPKGIPYDADILAEGIKFSANTVTQMLTAVVKDIGWLVDHSSKAKAELVKYPGKRVGTQFLAMAQKFHKEALKSWPHQVELQPDKIVGTTLNGARELEEYFKEDWDEKQLQAVLDWIPTDSFWRANFRSLGSARVKGRGGGLKLANAYAHMELANAATLMTHSQMMSDMMNYGLSTDDYEVVPDPRTGKDLFRRMV